MSRPTAAASFLAVCERHGLARIQEQNNDKDILCDAKHATAYAALLAATGLVSLHWSPVPDGVPFAQHASVLYGRLSIPELDELLTALEERTP